MAGAASAGSAGGATSPGGVTSAAGGATSAAASAAVAPPAEEGALVGWEDLGDAWSEDSDAFFLLKLAALSGGGAYAVKYVPSPLTPHLVRVKVRVRVRVRVRVTTTTMTAKQVRTGAAAARRVATAARRCALCGGDHGDRRAYPYLPTPKGTPYP